MKRIIVSLFLVFLVGCTSLTGTEKRPTKVSEEIWEQGQQISILIKNQTGDESSTKTVDDKGLAFMFSTYKVNAEEKATSEELDLIKAVEDYWYQSLFYGAMGKGEENNAGYYDALEKVEAIYGAKALEYSNYDEEKLTSLREIAETKVAHKEESDAENTPINKFKKQHNVKLDAREVQFDMSNHLDESFALEGYGELSNYYNYEFDDEELYFAARITPTEGSMADGWYIYFNREINSELYSSLLEGEKYIRVEAEIPNYYYEEGQGNMARAKAVEWYK